jgi:ABC-2 type transport system permease protein
MTTPPELLAGSATGSIYDLGYRRYDGPRLGRRHAIGALVRHGLRAIFGLGRSGRAKIVPLGLAGLIALPAVVSVAFTTLAGGAASEFNPITLEGYLQFSTVPLIFFLAAQAPELLVRDQRHRVLTLYFSRALERLDYIGAKYVALVLAIALVIGLPQVILLLGMLFATPNVADGAAAAAPLLAPAAARTAIVAALLAGAGLAACAFTVRRAFAAATVIAVFLVPSAIISILVSEVALDMPVALIALGDVVALIDGTSAFLFGSEPTTTTVLMSDVPVWMFAATAVIVALAALGLLVLRYRRIAA